MIGNFYFKNFNLESVDKVTSFDFSNQRGVYETLKLRDGVLFFPNDHIDRLFHSIKLFNLNDEINFSKQELNDTLDELVEKNKLSDANIRIYYIDQKESKELYLMMIDPIFPNLELYKNGVKTISVHGARNNSQVKYINPETSQKIYQKAKELGAYDALLVNGYVTEGTRTNIFLVKEGKFYTPPKERVLEGVTRKHVIEVIKNNGMEIFEEDIFYNSLQNFDGAFLTGTSTSVMPVNSIDNINFEIDNNIRFIQKKFDAYLKEYILNNKNGRN